MTLHFNRSLTTIGVLIGTTTVFGLRYLIIMASRLLPEMYLLPSSMAAMRVPSPLNATPIPSVLILALFMSNLRLISSGGNSLPGDLPSI